MQFYVGHKQSPAPLLKTMLDANRDKHSELASFRTSAGASWRQESAEKPTRNPTTGVITTPNDVVAIATAIGMVHPHILDRGYRD